MNRLLAAASALATLTAAAHAIGGQADTVAPLLAANLNETARLTLLGCWQVITVTLAGSALALGWAAMQPVPPRPLLAFIAACWALYGLAFAFVGWAHLGVGALGVLPQPLFCLPVAALAWWGRRSS